MARCLASGFGEEILQSHWLSSCLSSEELRLLEFSGIKEKSDSRGYLCLEMSYPRVCAARSCWEPLSNLLCPERRAPALHPPGLFPPSSSPPPLPHWMIL